MKISGYLWQKYPQGYPEEYINFPQLTDQVGGLVNEEVYRYTQNGQQTVGWFFSTEVQQRFDNRLYPLDQAIIKIQIEPSKLTSGYVLVPAVLDYDYMSPSVRPGLDRNLNVRGWTIRNSFFTYDESNYGSTFGLFRQIPKDAIPNLVFNVRMNRNILSPIIAYCIVIYIVVMQVYGLSILKIVGNRDQEHSIRFQHTMDFPDHVVLRENMLQNVNRYGHIEAARWKRDVESIGDAQITTALQE